MYSDVTMTKTAQDDILEAGQSKNNYLNNEFNH